MRSQTPSPNGHVLMMAPKKGGKMGHFGAFFLDADVKNEGIAQLFGCNTRVVFAFLPFLSRPKRSKIELRR